MSRQRAASPLLASAMAAAQQRTPRVPCAWSQHGGWARLPRASRRSGTQDRGPGPQKTYVHWIAPVNGKQGQQLKLCHPRGRRCSTGVAGSESIHNQAPPLPVLRTAACTRPTDQMGALFRRWMLRRCWQPGQMKTTPIERLWDLEALKCAKATFRQRSLRRMTFASSLLYVKASVHACASGARQTAWCSIFLLFHETAIIAKATVLAGLRRARRHEGRAAQDC